MGRRCSAEHQGTGTPSDQNGNNTYIFAPIPTEILEKVIENLDLPSVLSLRLTCRDLARRALGPHLLKTAYEKTTVDFTEARFSRLERIISNPVFGRAVKHLTVQAVVYYISDTTLMLCKLRFPGTPGSAMAERSEVERRFNWIADRRTEQALAELDEHEDVTVRLADYMRQLGGPTAETPTLHSGLELIGVVSPGHGLTENLAPSGPAIWNNVAKRASQAFYVAMNAMVHAGLKTPLLWIFSQTRRCSVPASTVSWLLRAVDNQELTRVMSGIKNFALSFAPVIGARVEMGLQPPDEGIDIYASPPMPNDDASLLTEAFRAVPRFIAMVSADVEVLDLHMFSPSETRAQMHSAIFTSLAENTEFSNLRDLTLRGLCVTAPSILQFLDKHGNRLRSLKLRDIWLAEGDWHAIFRKLQPDTLPNVRCLRLENLFRRRVPEDADNNGVFRGWVLLDLTPKGPFQRTGIDRNGEKIHYNITSCPLRCRFPSGSGNITFVREWDGEAFFLESRDEHGVSVGLEFEEADVGNPYSSYLYTAWTMTRADEFGPAPKASEWERYQASLD